MTVVFPGDAVPGLIANATSRVVIAAPYIKSATIRQLFRKVPEIVSELFCVTRWLPEDIASDICDLEVFNDVMEVQGGQLLIHPHLHAKYYSNGQETLVGSANLTARGLGWHTPANVELLVALPAEFPGLTDWEALLLDSAVVATEQLREQIRKQAEQLLHNGPISHAPEVGNETEEDKRVTFWVPRCPVPERLWEVYCGGGADIMVSSAFKAAQDDLTALSPPQGLTKDLFTAYVAGILRQMPLLTEIDRLALTGLTDAKAYKFLSEHLTGDAGDVNEFDQIWRIVKLWLIFFFPESYRLETGQEVLIKGKEILRVSPEQ